MSVNRVCPNCGKVEAMRANFGKNRKAERKFHAQKWCDCWDDFPEDNKKKIHIEIERPEWLQSVINFFSNKKDTIQNDSIQNDSIENDSINPIQDLLDESIPVIEKTTTKSINEIKILLIKLQKEVSKKDKEDNSLLRQMYYLMHETPGFDKRLKSSEIYYNLATEFYNLKDYKAAFDLFSKSIKSYPTEHAYLRR